MGDTRLGTDAAYAGAHRATGVPRVLVVEDVDTTRQRMCSALRARGYQVDEARDGAEGMRLLSATSSHFDAILLDLLLPQLDGWQFREAQLRQPQLARIPTIIVTVRPLREPDRYALRARTVIQKPFEDDALIAMVATACAGADGGGRAAVPAAPARTGPVTLADGELFWSRLGEVACTVHAPGVASERWVAERWTAIPRGAGRDRLTYQCQHCSGSGPIHHRSAPRLVRSGGRT
jgi:CheY-like chemotaxis protein